VVKNKPIKNALTTRRRHRFHPFFGKQSKNQGYFFIGSKRTDLRAFPDPPDGNGACIRCILSAFISGFGTCDTFAEVDEEL
jgi:hypothetical protein